MKLNQETLAILPSFVRKPLYGRDILNPSIVHIGVGNFHRAHQAFYQDKLLGNNDTDWTICGMGVKLADERVYKTLKEQDFLYTLMVKHPAGKIESRIIGAITDFIFVPDNPIAAIEKLADSRTKIVTLTITEGGYNFNQNGEFITDNPDVAWDIRHLEAPKTVFGLISAALKIRMEENIPAFTIVSCDNIQHNGAVARKMLLSFTNIIDKSLSEWIQANVCFPNSMVDRITPVTNPDDIKRLYEETGIEDSWPVTCEPYIQWVLEDNFSNGRPAWEKVGVQFTTDIEPFEKMKIRLLNAGHSLLGMIGLLYGYTTVDEAVNDSGIQKLLRAFFDTEVTPILGTIENINLNEYKDSLIERFKNPNINDQLTRICSESSAKLPKFLIPTIREQLEMNGPVEYSALILAAWCRLLELHGQEGNNYKFHDEILDVLKKNAKSSAEDDPMMFLQTSSVFGDLVNNARFIATYLNSLENIRKSGIKKIVNHLIE
jgi:mannitol 2-dehydrogenase